MRVLKGLIPENTAGKKGGGRQPAVNKTLQWNTRREVQKIRWKEMKSKRMGYANLQWRRNLIADTMIKAKECLFMNEIDRIKKFGTSST